MTEAFICDAIRTPVGRYNGGLSAMRVDDLAAHPIKALMQRNANVDWGSVDDVIYGCVNQAGEDNRNVARMAGLLAGLPVEVSGSTITRLCGSGLDAVNLAARAIRTGECDLIIAGGVESMSRVALAADGGAMMVDPVFAFDHYYVPQGIGADMIATIHGFSREDVDGYAVQSQRRAALAWQEGRFARSIVPVLDQAGMVILDHDEHMRPQTDMDSLAKLRPAFVKLGESGYDAVAQARYSAVLAKQGKLDAARKHLQGIQPADDSQRIQWIQAEANLLREANDHKSAYELLGKALEGLERGTGVIRMLVLPR